MTFLQPWAWLGLIAVAAPIAAHLLARRSARRLAFPTVRFLPAPIQTPISRHRLTDILVLVIRCLILIAAVAALAQPVWPTSDRRQALGDSLARAIVVDSGVAAAAKPLATELSSGSTVARVASADVPAQLIGEASTWLAQQAMRRELVLVSDFRTSTLSKADLDRVPADIGIKLVPVHSSARFTGPIELRDGPLMLTGAGDQAAALAARDAAVAHAGRGPGRKDRPVALLFAGHQERDALLKEAREIDQPWMFDVFRAITQDPLVNSAALEAGRPVLENVSPLATRINRETHLLLVMAVPPASLMTAAVIRATAQAVAPAQATGNVSLSDDQLKAWERPAGAVAPESTQFPDDSGGRWLWLAALMLMIIERVITQRARRPQAAVPTEVRDVARVA